MKKLFFLCVLSAPWIAAAQWINSITVQPPSPTTNDSVFVYADCSFTAGSCPPWTMNHFINGNSISANALHCVGMLTVICPYTDTFALGLLPAGTYTFTFQLDEGHGGPPCTPGIVPGPSSTISFNVSFPTAAPSQHSADSHFSVFPNPVTDFVSVKSKAEEEIPVRIFDVSGSKVREQNLIRGEAEIYLGDLARGIYFLESGRYHFRIAKQ
jgi:hypothetical protein